MSQDSIPAKVILVNVFVLNVVALSLLFKATKSIIIFVRMIDCYTWELYIKTLFGQMSFSLVSLYWKSKHQASCSKFSKIFLLRQQNCITYLNSILPSVIHPYWWKSRCHANYSKSLKIYYIVLLYRTIVYRKLYSAEWHSPSCHYAKGRGTNIPITNPQKYLLF